MSKELALEKIRLVKSKRNEDYIQSVMIEIEDFVNLQESFSYQELMNFIQTKYSNKLGGIYMYINKALDFLKNELKSCRMIN